jgi:hypothetical protein
MSTIGIGSEPPTELCYLTFHLSISPSFRDALERRLNLAFYLEPPTT